MPEIRIGRGEGGEGCVKYLISAGDRARVYARDNENRRPTCPPPPAPYRPPAHDFPVRLQLRRPRFGTALPPSLPPPPVLPYRSVRIFPLAPRELRSRLFSASPPPPFARPCSFLSFLSLLHIYIGSSPFKRTHPDACLKRMHKLKIPAHAPRAWITARARYPGNYRDNYREHGGFTFCLGSFI